MKNSNNVRSVNTDLNDTNPDLDASNPDNYDQVQSSTMTATIPDLPDFDIEFDNLDYGDPIPNVPTWIEHEDGSGEWSDGWKPKNTVVLPQDTFEAYIDSMGFEFGINDYPEDWAL